MKTKVIAQLAMLAVQATALGLMLAGIGVPYSNAVAIFMCVPIMIVGAL